MKRFTRKIASGLVIIIAMTLILPLTAGAVKVGDSEISSTGAVVLDFETNVVLFGHNEAVRRVPASMVKMVAVYVVYDAIQDGWVTMDSRLVISAGVSEFSRNTTYSNVPLEEGQLYSVRELLEAVIVRSASAATVALGEGIFGSERAFVQRMNAKAASMNIWSDFRDSWGGSRDSRVSPLALAWIMRALIMDYPEVLEITSLSSITFRDFRNGEPLPASNHLLSTYPGADGLKTGFTIPAGHCLIGTAERDGRRLITVTMGNTVTTRYPDTITLLDFGFANADKIIAEHQANVTVTPPPPPPLPPANVPVMPSNKNLMEIVFWVLSLTGVLQS